MNRDRYFDPRCAQAIAILWLSACAPAVPPPGSAGPIAYTAGATSARDLFERGRVLAAQGDASRAEQYFALALRAGYPDAVTTVALVQVCVASSRLRAALGQ